MNDTQVIDKIKSKLDIDDKFVFTSIMANLDRLEEHIVEDRMLQDIRLIRQNVISIFNQKECIKIENICEGIAKYAYWQNGIQYVGNCGTTLVEAFAEEINKLGDNTCSE